MPIKDVICIISRLLETAPQVTGLHLEPFGFQVTPNLGEATKKQSEIFNLYEWNVNFFEILNLAQDKGLIKIDFVETDLFLPEDPTNATSVAIWKKR